MGARHRRVDRRRRHAGRTAPATGGVRLSEQDFQRCGDHQRRHEPAERPHVVRYRREHPRAPAALRLHVDRRSSDVDHEPAGDDGGRNLDEAIGDDARQRDRP